MSKDLVVRNLKKDDYNFIAKWWRWWRWKVIPKEMLPENGLSGLMVEKEGVPIIAGFIYTTNSKGVWLEWVISDPEYRDDDRQQALELLISGAENVCKAQGFKYVLFVGKHNNLINTFEKLGWNVDRSPSYELIKTIN